MSQMDSRIILGAQQPNLVNAFAQGQALRAQSDQLASQNALRNLYQTQGANIFAGDQNALNSLAQIDPAQALAIRGQHQVQGQRDQAMQMRIAEYAKTISKEQAAAEAAKLEQGIVSAIGMYQAGDLNGLNALLEKAGIPPIPELEAFVPLAAQAGDALDILKSVTEFSAGPKPADEYGRYVAEETEAGRTPLDRISYAQAKKGKGFEVTMPDGTKVSYGGASSDPDDITKPSSPAAMIASIDGILNDPALGTSTGILAPLQNIPGTPQRRVGARIDQLDGQAFLQAFESLKGGGQITEIEGQKATQAIGRLDDYQNPEDYKQALVELRDILKTAMGRPPGWADQQSATPGEIPTITDEEGYNALPSGTVFIAPDGTQRRKP